MDLMTPASFNLPPDLHTRTSILKHMLQVAVDGDRQSHQLLQESIAHLGHKAVLEEPFVGEEISFLKTLYTCPWWGGKEFGVNETKDILTAGGEPIEQSGSVTPVADSLQVCLAQMARHYVHGKGQILALNVAIYQRASVVKDAVDALRDYIRELYTFKKPATQVSTTDVAFLASKYARQIESRRRHFDTKGFVFNDGTLILDQRDPRLLVLGNRFRITAMTSPMGTHLMSRWRVEGIYQFESFVEGPAETVLPLHDKLTLRLPSALGVSLMRQGLARPFNYFADWAERYPLATV